MIGFLKRLWYTIAKKQASWLAAALLGVSLALQTLRCRFILLQNVQTTVVSHQQTALDINNLVRISAAYFGDESPVKLFILDAPVGWILSPNQRRRPADETNPPSMCRIIYASEHWQCVHAAVAWIVHVRTARSHNMSGIKLYLIVLANWLKVHRFDSCSSPRFHPRGWEFTLTLFFFLSHVETV